MKTPMQVSRTHRGKPWEILIANSGKRTGCGENVLWNSEYTEPLGSEQVK